MFCLGRGKFDFPRQAQNMAKGLLNHSTESETPKTSNLIPQLNNIWTHQKKVCLDIIAAECHLIYARLIWYTFQKQNNTSKSSTLLYLGLPALEEMIGI